MVGTSSAESSTLVFFVNGKKVVHENPNPEWTLLYFLRYKLKLRGTKEGCSEGGCGACTVLLSRFDRSTRNVINTAVNACLTPVCSVHGSAIVTVEGIGSLKAGLHPVQERIAKSFGTQCGFCTPGFVMSMYALLRTNSQPTEKDLEDAFQGNLCRCTGYRPILSGFKTFCGKSTSEQNGGCCMQNGNGGGGCCMEKKSGVTKGCDKDGLKNDTHQVLDTLFDESEFKPYDPTQDPIFPPELKLDTTLDSTQLNFNNERVTWYRPNSLATALRLKSQYPEARIVAGNTELGVDAKFKGQVPPVYIQINAIPELTEITHSESSVSIGAGVSLTNFDNYCVSQPDRPGSVFLALSEMIHWFAGQQIRNAATIGGNIFTASPISDLNPIFMAAGCSVELVSESGSRLIKMDEKFFTSYRQTVIKADEIIKSVIIPTTAEDEFIWSAKQSKRREDDIAIVNTGMRIKLNDDGTIQDSTLVFGGMAATTRIANQASAYLIGKKWSLDLVEEIAGILQLEFPLESNAPGGMIGYRQSLPASLFFKFYLSVTNLKWLSEKLTANPAASSVSDSEESAIRPCTRLETKASQLYQVVPPDQPVIDLVGRPVVHVSGLKHATGEAAYVDDIPIQDNELYGAHVYNTSHPHGRILSIDASQALALPGVVEFFDSNSIPPERNQFGPISHDEEVFASKEVSCIGHVVGFLVAQDQLTAERAAKLVKIHVEPITPTILSVEDAIEHDSYYDKQEIRHGNVEEALKNSDEVLEGEMRVGGQEHFYMETQSCLAVPKEDNELDVYLSTQAPSPMQQHIAECLGLPSNRVVVKTRRVGGAFGGKEHRCALVALPTSIAAHKLKVPVRCVMNRYDDMQITGFRPPYLFRYKVGFQKDGRINGIRIEIYINAGISVDICGPILGVTTMSLDGPFKITNWHIDGFVCKTNIPSNTAFRGFGNPEGAVVMHSIFEQVAERLGLDSFQIRQMHFFKEGDSPIYGSALTYCTLDKCWAECIQTSNYQERLKLVEEFNSKNRWKKRGIALTATKHHIGFEMPFMMQGAALVMIYLDGTVSLNHGGTELGQGIHTKMLQVVTRALEVPIEKVHFSETSSDKVPNAIPTCGSMTSDLCGMAVLNACEELKKRLEPFKKQNPSGTWENWVQAAFFARTNLSATGFYKCDTPYVSFGAACSEVEIDCLTGDHSVLRTDIVMDVGESLNPGVDIGQIEGAFVQAYGLFTLEELMFSPKGHLLTKGPGTYKIPTMSDIPQQFYVSLLRGAPNPKAVYSSKGIGEPPMTLATSVFFAIRNAVKAARNELKLPTTFKFDSPATAERIRMACEDQFTARATSAEKGSKNTWSIAV